LSKEPQPVHTVLRAFATERGVRLLVLMSLVMDEESGSMQRGLAVYATERVVGAAVVARLVAPEGEGAVLELSELSEVGEWEEGGALWVFWQGNTQSSRKQVEPVLRRLLEDPALTLE
jgi:hypothetical protein